jgi:hypothetical protein
MADKRFTKEMSMQCPNFRPTAKKPKLKLKEFSQFAAERRIDNATFTKFGNAIVYTVHRTVQANIYLRNRA